MRAAGGATGQRTGNLETKFRAPPPAQQTRRPAVPPSGTADLPPIHRRIADLPSSRVRHVWFLQRRRYEESGSTTPAGGRAQPREGFAGSCRFETILSAECST
uniref:Uncharacterized protein n=1 Tax=Monodon monoceros TaxID=40151 RepID=A0A8C6B576_MONMO